MKEYKIDFSHCVTLPQLAMEVFRSVYLKSNKLIRLLSNRHYNFIKEAFRGANVSVYKPYGEKLYAYDVNSLYPYCMLKPMPVGTPKPYDVSMGLQDFFGFAYAEVTCPEDIKIPVLPLKTMVNGTEKLIFPTGVFKGTFFSEELKYAEKLGYSIKLIRGLEFNKSYNLFHEYVHNFYNKKLTSNGAIKAISKLFLNSLYGRFAIQKDFEFNFITSSDTVKDQVLNIFSFIKPEPLDNNSVLFNFSQAPNENLKDADEILYNLLFKFFSLSSEGRIGNIAIAAAITAYARCDIDRYKRLPGNECYYSDTDCVHLQHPLPSHMIGDGLGMMKNELADSNYSVAKDVDYYYSKGLFLRDKVYSIVLQNGSEITKFSGLNRRLIPENCFNLLYDAYVSGNPLKIRNEMLRRNINDLKVSHVELDKIFTFNYDKRKQVLNSKGLWIDTLPINIKPGANISQLIRKQQVALNDQQYGLAPFTGEMNKSAICNSSYKHFDNYFLNYVLPVKSDPVTTLKELIDLASKEGVLVPGVHYLLTEYYGFRRNTINYLTNFVSKTELINIYSQHIDSVLSQGISVPLKEKGEESSVYIVDKLSLRIRIPSEYKPK